MIFIDTNIAIALRDVHMETHRQVSALPEVDSVMAAIVGAAGLEPVWLPPQRVRVGAGQFIDNFLDFAHFPFVHAATIGSDEALEVPEGMSMLMAAVGKVANHAGQATPYLTPLHGKANILKPLIANIRAALQHVKATAEQFKTADPWAVLMRYVSDRIAPTLGPFRHMDVLPATG